MGTATEISSTACVEEQLLGFERICLRLSGGERAKIHLGSARLRHRLQDPD